MSPAKNAGIEPADVIIAADGKPTDRVSTLQRIVRSHKPGETVAFDVMHFGKKKTFDVKLTEAPDDAQLVAAARIVHGMAQPSQRVRSRASSTRSASRSSRCRRTSAAESSRTARDWWSATST